MLGVGWVLGYIALQQLAFSADMAVAQELYSFPASKLDSFVAQWLQPTREWKEEVLETVQTVEQFLRQENFRGERGPAQDVRVLKVLKVRLDLSIPSQDRAKPSARGSPCLVIPYFMIRTFPDTTASCLQPTALSGMN